MTRPRKNAKVVSRQADQRPVLFLASIVLLAALLLAGCAKVPYPPPSLQATNANAPSRTASTPTASATPRANKKPSPDLTTVLSTARQAQTRIAAPSAPTRAQFQSGANRLQRLATAARAAETKSAASEKMATKAALERQQRLAAQAKAERDAQARAAAKKRAQQAAAKAESDRQTRLALQAEANRKAAAKRQANKAMAARVDEATSPLAEPPALPPAPTPSASTPSASTQPAPTQPAPTQAVSSSPLSEPELALQIASRGGTDGGASKVESEATSEPSLLTSLARLSPAAGGAEGNLTGIGGADLSVAFSEGSGELSVDARNQLFELAQRLQEGQGIDVRLFGYADSLGEGPSRARRLSLSRLMTVRKFLIRQGVSMDSLDGRAMGEDPVAENTTDRVDIVIVRR